MDADVIIIGSGAGGSAVARSLADTGKQILVLERGDYVPREPQNWSAEEVFMRGRYLPDEKWEDRHGHLFQPQAHYNVGGATKFYGAALFRMPEETFAEWPVTSREMQPWYDRAERFDWYNVTRLPDVPAVARLRGEFDAAGMFAESAPSGVDYVPGRIAPCIACARCDGFPCPLLAKRDGEGVMRIALTHPNVELRRNTTVIRLFANTDGRITGVRVITPQGESQVLRAPVVVLAAGAVNSAALLLRTGLTGSSGLAGTHYMSHMSTALLAIRHQPLEEADNGFHKTLCVPRVEDPELGVIGSVQMTGRPVPEMFRGESALARHCPELLLEKVATHALGLWLMTEDPAARYNRVELSETGRIRLIQEDGGYARLRHSLLQGRVSRILREAGYKVLAHRMPLAAVAHQCGTLRMHSSRQYGFTRPDGQAWDYPNLYIADASAFTTSGYVNPAMTVVANALRVSEVIRSVL